MEMRFLLLTALCVILVVAAGFAAWVLSLPPLGSAGRPVPISPAEKQALLDALKPDRNRPLVAVIGINDATETTDYLMPAGVLRRADVADVELVATGPGEVQLYPALKVLPDATTTTFDRRHPEGADYVIVPAMSRDDDPLVAGWLKSQAAKGATIIGVCAGAKILGEAGLLDGRRATTHWYYLKQLQKGHPTIRYVPDRRFVADGPVVTTTGITASMPMALMLVEAIAGPDKAKAVARGLALDSWDARHASDMFKLTRPFALTVMANKMRFWRRDELGLELHGGDDEVSLALLADAWSRTYRSTVISFVDRPKTVVTLGGIKIRPDRVASVWRGQKLPSGTGAQKPMEALKTALGSIGNRYGPNTSMVVAMQLEFAANP